MTTTGVFSTNILLGILSMKKLILPTFACLTCLKVFCYLKFIALNITILS